MVYFGIHDIEPGLFSLILAFFSSTIVLKQCKLFAATTGGVINFSFFVFG
jgi:hypothetical protein